jgi:hypothetical protein
MKDISVEYAEVFAKKKVVYGVTDRQKMKCRNS